MKVIFSVLSILFCFSYSYSQSKKPDPFKSDYVGYVPDFVKKVQGRNKRDYWFKSKKEMERSSEKKYYTLSEIEEVSRADALVKAAINSETKSDYRKAMAMYQSIILKFNKSQGYKEILYRVSDYGVFVPVAQYCQRRILNFPPEHLNFYRTLHDAEAKELYIEAVRKYSLELFSEIIDKYLATSYGGKALQFLGDAALDRGNFLEALEYYQTILKNIPDKKLRTPELNLKIQLCQKSIGAKAKTRAASGKSLLKSSDFNILKRISNNVKYVKPKVLTQSNSKGFLSSDDYTQHKKSKDPLGLKIPEWSQTLANSRNDFFVYTQPVISDTSVIYRYKNVIYSYSLISGELRWKSEIGGRAVWQSWRERQFPMEDIVVHDGVVVTPILKGGSSLVALDEITGQIKWAHGPMAVSEGYESMMRFECAPTAGPGTIYATYVLDNIKGSTHIDTEYGIVAYDSSTGRMKWRRQISRLQPGKFDGGFGVTRRNRIRSFFSPPLYHQGTLYVNTNAGVMAALNSISGRVKWLIRYPYFRTVHDLTRKFGSHGYGSRGNIHGGMLPVRPQSPSFWLNQRPLVVADKLYVTPVDTPYLFSIDRKTGKINWTFRKPTSGFEYFLGAISTGELVIAANGRNVVPAGGRIKYHPIYLVDPKTGKITWKSPDYVIHDSQPVMDLYIYGIGGLRINHRYMGLAARPFLTNDDKVILTSWTDNSPYYRLGCQVFALGEIDLKNRKVLKRRRYYSSPLLAGIDHFLFGKGSAKRPSAPEYLKSLLEIPRPSKRVKQNIKIAKAFVGDSVPVNKHPAFMPFLRMTVTRYGIPFELRVSPRKMSMVYDRKKFEEFNKPKTDLNSTFGKAELAKKDGDFVNAAKYLGVCLSMVSPEDVNFRALLKQQFYKVYVELVRSSIRGNFPKDQLKNTTGMSNTASVLAEEVETLFALAEAYEKNGKYKNAANCLRNLIEIYGEHEFPISDYAKKSMFEKTRMAEIMKTTKDVFEKSQKSSNQIYNKSLTEALSLNLKSINLYSSAVSPLPKDLSLRTGDLAINKLITLLASSGDFKNQYAAYAKVDLKSEDIDQLIYHIWKYPGTEIGQNNFNKLYSLSKKLSAEDQRYLKLKLKHISNVCKFKIPSSELGFYKIPAYNNFKSINGSTGDKEYEVGKFKDGIMMLMERSGDRSIKPNFMFLSVRLPKRVGNKFSIVCFDLSAGKEAWRINEFRLKGLGKEPGFYKAFVHENIVVVHGVSDVLGFELNTGKKVWHYKSPDSFEIQKALISGNLFYICSTNETIALQIKTKSPVGEVAWQQKEEGQIYHTPYFVGEKFISIRKYPFNITSRFRTTGSLISRMAIPDLMLLTDHPFVKTAEKKLSLATYNNLLVVTDGWYILVYDVVDMKMLWKTLILNKDWSNETAIRFVINDQFLVVTKMDYDQKVMSCFDVKTGREIWKTDYKNSATPRPLYSFSLEGTTLYGIGEYSGQGFNVMAYECTKGKRFYKKLYKDYTEKPKVVMDSQLYGNQFVIKIQDRKSFQLLVIDKKTGKPFKSIKSKGDGPIGAPGRVSMTVQNGHPVLFSKIKFKY
ncbi:MAG: hypothetical protein COA79_05980 [Planctomycetota bacterium]|nr:MAG: hypothetical protein COA79_05980 [Planctomycetota bacterium]